MVTQEYQTVELSLLHESTFNPRRTFNQTALEQLADSIKTQGLIQPLTVRPMHSFISGGDPAYEIVAGARRYRAAKLAGVETVPVRIVELTDAQALEVAVVENLQRADVHPLEEADGFKALLSHEGYDIETVADKTGRNPRFIAERLRLCDLIPPVREAYQAELIYLGHALTIAKLTPENQIKALRACWYTQWRQGTVDDLKLFTEDELKALSIAKGTEGDGEDYEEEYEEEFVEHAPVPKSPVVQILGAQNWPIYSRPLPVKEFQNWCGKNFLLVLERAPFDIHDATLYPEAGSCDTCPKRTFNNALLFSEKTPDACTDPTCYAEKVQLHIERAVAAGAQPVSLHGSHNAPTGPGAPLYYGQYTPIDPEFHTDNEWQMERAEEDGVLTACDEAIQGVVVTGPEEAAGKVILICTSLTCAVHPRQREAALKSAPKDAFDGLNEEQRKEKKREERAQSILEAKIKVKTEANILDAIVQTVPAKLAADDLRWLCKVALSRIQYGHLDSVAEKLGQKMPNDKQERKVTEANVVDYIDNLPLKDLPQLLVLLTLWTDQMTTWNRPNWDTAVKLYDVNPKAIEKATRKELTDAAKAKTKATKKAA